MEDFRPGERVLMDVEVVATHGRYVFVRELPSTSEPLMMVRRESLRRESDLTPPAPGQSSLVDPT
jgi:hypothetical protein